MSLNCNLEASQLNMKKTSVLTIFSFIAGVVDIAWRLTLTFECLRNLSKKRARTGYMKKT